MGANVDLAYFPDKIKNLLKTPSQTDSYQLSKEEQLSTSERKSWFLQLSKCRGGSLYLELKPSMGDDFPAVLRQIKVNKKRVIEKNRPYVVKAAWVLVIGAYTGQGATFEEVKKLFNTENIYVVLEQEIEGVQLPQYEPKITIESLEIGELQESLKIVEKEKI